MKKKLVVVITLVLMVFLASINVGQASDKPVAPETSDKFPARLQRAASIDTHTETDTDRLEQIAKEDGIEAPEGYSLVSVTTKFVPLEAEKEQALVEDEGIAPKSTYITYITNVKSAGNKYYSSDYDSYTYGGPGSVSTTYSQTRSSNYTATTSVSSSLVSSAVGFSVNSSWTYSQGYSTTIPAGQILVVRVHMNYSVKTFDVYRRLSSEPTGSKIGSGSAWRPIGLLIKEYRYS